MPIDLIDHSKREAFIARANRGYEGGGVVTECIVHRTEACLERGGMYLAPPTNAFTVPVGAIPAGGAHICPACGAYLRGNANSEAQPA